MCWVQKYTYQSVSKLVAVTAIFGITSFGADSIFGQTEITQRKESLAVMRSVAERFSVQDKGGKQFQYAMHDTPIFRYGGTARGWNDGTIWVYGKKSMRPALLMTVAVEDGEVTVEASSLADKPIEFGGGAQETWRPSTPAVVFAPIKDAGQPSPNERLRGLELGEIAKSFKSYEYWYTEDRSEGKQRFQLRLVPRPIWRYEDKAREIVDGAIFLYCYGTNPEVIGLIEARKDDSGTLKWHAGFTRSAGADLFVFRNETEFWKPPARDARGAYTNFDVVAPGK